MHFLIAKNFKTYGKGKTKNKTQKKHRVQNTSFKIGKFKKYK